MNIRTIALVTGALFLSLVILPCPAAASVVSFEQLNWVDDLSATPDSSWGRVTLDFVGSSIDQYFNLTVGSEWVVQNMSVGSLYGAGVSQTVSTFFDLGVEHGVDVPEVVYSHALGDTPLLSPPVLGSELAPVADTDYQIGGEDDIDLGSPGPVDRGTSSGAPVYKSGQIPDLDKFINQPQGTNDCARAAVSNSLNYLKATGKIDFTETMAEVKAWAGTSSSGGTPSDWYTKKKAHLEAKGMTVRFIEAPLTAAKLEDLIAQLEDGQDIEMDLAGHVEVLVGLRWLEDGTVELDLFDDDQTDGNNADGMHTSTLRASGSTQYVDGMRLERFVIECPEPSTMCLLVLGGLAVIRRRRAA